MYAKSDGKLVMNTVGGEFLVSYSSCLVMIYKGAISTLANWWETTFKNGLGYGTGNNEEDFGNDSFQILHLETELLLPLQLGNLPLQEAV